MSHWKYRSTNKGSKQIEHFEQAWLTQFSSSRKRFNQIVYCIAAFFKLIVTKPQLNIFFTQPPLFIIWGAWISRIKGIPYGIHLMDLYPDLVGALGYLNTDKWLYKWLDKRMTRALVKADFVVVIGRCMEEHILNKGVAKDKMTTVINVPSISDSGQNSNFLKKEGLDEKFTILYAGNMGVAHEFSTLVKLIKEFEISKPDIHFLIVGKGFRRHELEKYIIENKQTNLTLFGYLENEEFEAILSETDVHFISLRDSFNGLMVPSKLYSSLALSKPVVFEGSSKNEISRAIEEDGIGVNVAHGDVDGLREAFLHFYLSQDSIEEASRNSKNYFKNSCNVETIIKDYSNYLIKLLP